MHRMLFIARKEVYHLLRDPRSLIIIFLMPVMMTALYGYAINMDINTVRLAVIDLDHSKESVELTERFYRSTYFERAAVTTSLQNAEDILRRQEASGILTIRPGFGAAVKNGQPFDLGLTIDGSDNLLGAAVQAYAQGVLGRFLTDQLPPEMELPGVTVSHQVLYNSDLESSHFFVPAIVAIILIMISALLTSVTIAREKETGTMEQLLMAPVHPHEILVGKIAPYILVAFIDGLLVLLFAKVFFAVPFQGSFPLLMLFTVLYVTAALSIGILISSLVSTQQVAMMYALVATLLPSIMLSGFIFAIKNLPIALQVLSFIVPARYFIEATRGIMLKGSGLEVLTFQALSLVALMMVLLVVATKRFRTRIN